MAKTNSVDYETRTKGCEIHRLASNEAGQRDDSCRLPVTALKLEELFGLPTSTIYPSEQPRLVRKEARDRLLALLHPEAEGAVVPETVSSFLRAIEQIFPVRFMGIPSRSNHDCI